MIVNEKQTNHEHFINDLKKRSKEQILKNSQEKEKLKQEILLKWKQHKSIFFWNKCFRALKLQVIRDSYNNINALMLSGYPVNNPAGLFVSSLKAMGYFPFPQEDSIA